MTKEEIGTILRNKMDELNLTLYKVEKLSNLPGKQIKKVFNGKDNYTFDTLNSLCKVLNYKIEIQPEL